MGLFDNLFLDKNTPMAINTGDTKLSDIPPAASPATVGGGAGSAQGGGNPPTGGSSQTGLSQTVSPQIPSPSQGTGQFLQGTNVNPLTPGGVVPSDIPLTSGISSDHGTLPISTTPDTNISFDIGGDMLFGDMSTENTGMKNSVTSSSGADGFVVNDIPITDDSAPGIQILATEVPAMPESLVVSSSITDVGSPIILSDDPIGAHEDTSSPIIMATAETPKGEIQAGSVVATESPLMNLMSGFESTQSSTLIVSSETPIINPTSMPTPTPVVDPVMVIPASSDALFSLIDTANATAPTPVPIIEEKPVEMKSEMLIEASTPQFEEIHNLTPASITNELTPSEDQSAPMTSVGKELARMTRSPRLQGKLIGFISGLEELSNEEEILKNEKRKQIESYMIRISELKTEYETRIHALELEMENLTEQITTMDEEREHITQVIDGFKRELEVV